MNRSTWIGIMALAAGSALAADSSPKLDLPEEAKKKLSSPNSP